MLMVTPGVGPDCSNLSLGDSSETSRLLGRSDKGLGNFDDEIEASVEDELTREVFKCQ